MLLSAQLTPIKELSLWKSWADIAGEFFILGSTFRQSFETYSENSTQKRKKYTGNSEKFNYDLWVQTII